MQLQSHTAHATRDLGVVHLFEVALCGLFSSCPWSSCHWLTWVMAPLPLTMPALALHSAALSYSHLGRRCLPPKLAAAIDPTWLCHSCRLIIRLITPPLWFLPQLIASAFFPAGLPQDSPQKSKAILWNEEWAKIGRQIWSDVRFVSFDSY